MHDPAVPQVQALGVRVAGAEPLDGQDAVEIARHGDGRLEKGLDLGDEEHARESERSGQERRREVRPAAGRQEPQPRQEKDRGGAGADREDPGAGREEKTQGEPSRQGRGEEIRVPRVIDGRGGRGQREERRPRPAAMKP